MYAVSINTGKLSKKKKKKKNGCTRVKSFKFSRGKGNSEHQIQYSKIQYAEIQIVQKVGQRSSTVDDLRKVK